MLRAVLVIAMAACRGPALPALPSQGGPAWVELESDHFTLWTDASPARGRQLIREMEHLRQIVLGVGFVNAAAEGRSFVIALRDGREVGEFATPAFAAYAWSGGSYMQPVILLPADTDESDNYIVTHELAHVISYHVIRNQPRWFSEGLANFFATVRLDPDRAQGDIGEPLPHLTRRLRRHTPTPAAAMLGCDAAACMDESFYATAWATFAYLATRYPQQLLQYAQHLDDVPSSPAGHARAWHDVFPALTPAVLDRELRQWLAYGRHNVWKFAVKLQQWPITERPLTDGDVHAARALLRYILMRERPELQTELTAALAANPTNIVARMVRVALDKTITLEDARRVAQAHPEDWRSWWLVGLAASWQGDEAAAARAKACALLAKRPSLAAPTDWCQPQPGP
jgi:hypothetical protein